MILSEIAKDITSNQIISPIDLNSPDFQRKKLLIEILTDCRKKKFSVENSFELRENEIDKEIEKVPNPTS